MRTLILKLLARKSLLDLLNKFKLSRFISTSHSKVKCIFGKAALLS